MNAPQSDIIMSKITTKDIGLTKPVLVNLVEHDKSGPVVMRVYGKINGLTTRTSRVGSGLERRYLGKFRAINALTGQGYRGQALYIPDLADMYIEEAVEKLIKERNQEKDGSVTAIFDEGAEFVCAFDISVLPNESSLIKDLTPYKFGVKPLKQVAPEEDFLLQLGEELGMPPLLNPANPAPQIPSAGDAKKAPAKK